jgi:hypothetical protein
VPVASAKSVLDAPSEVTTNGPKYESAEAASKAAGFDVPECKGATSYNYDAQAGAVFAHFGQSDLVLRVSGSFQENLAAPIPAEAAEHFHSFDLKVAGSDAIGREWDGELMKVKRSDGVHEVGAVHTGWVAWNHGESGNMFTTDVVGNFQAVVNAASSCIYG